MGDRGEESQVFLMQFAQLASLLCRKDAPMLDYTYNVYLRPTHDADLRRLISSVDFDETNDLVICPSKCASSPLQRRLLPRE